MSVAWAAFEQLYLRRAQEVHNTIYYYLCRRQLSDHDMAGELTGKTFEQAWHALPKKNAQSPFVPWIKRVGLHEAGQYMRQRQKITNLTPDTSFDPSDLATEEHVERLLLSAALQDRITRIKVRLPRRQLEVFTKHYEEGLSLQEIAKELKLKPSTISQTLYRANVRFTDEWLKEDASSDSPLPAYKLNRRGTHGAPNQS